MSPDATLPPAAVGGVGDVGGVWTSWEQPASRLRPDQWQFALHASRPLTDRELDRLIRLNAALGRAAVVMSRPRPSPWGPPVQQPPWYYADVAKNKPMDINDPYLFRPRPPPPAPPPAPLHPLPPWWEGWVPAAAILLALLLLMARFMERCFTNKLKRRHGMAVSRPRPGAPTERSGALAVRPRVQAVRPRPGAPTARPRPGAAPAEEWQTPVVRATAPTAPCDVTRPLRLPVDPPPYTWFFEPDDPENPADVPTNPTTDGSHLHILHGLTEAERTAFHRQYSARYMYLRRLAETDADLPTDFNFRDYPELCRIREIIKRDRDLFNPPPSYSSVVRDAAPPYNSVVFNNNESVSFSNDSEVSEIDAFLNMNNHSGLYEPQVADNNVQAAPMYSRNAQGNYVNTNCRGMNFRTNKNGLYNNSTESTPNYENVNINITRHEYVTNHDETLIANDVVQGMVDDFDDDHEGIPGNPSTAYERHFVPESDGNVAKSLPITESMLANSDILKRHRRYNDPAAMRRTLEREVEALADQERDEVVMFGDLAAEDVTRSIDKRDGTCATANARERDEVTIELNNDMNAGYGAMEQDDAAVDIAGANDFDDDAQRALDFAETQIDNTNHPRA